MNPRKTNFTLRRILRIRPLIDEDQKKRVKNTVESEKDILLLQVDPSSNLDHSTQSTAVRLNPPPSMDKTTPLFYHYDSVFGTNTSQQLFYQGVVTATTTTTTTATTTTATAAGVFDEHNNLVQSLIDMLERNTRNSNVYQHYYMGNRMTSSFSSCSSSSSSSSSSNNNTTKTCTNHLLISLGVSNSGKTHSLFGSSSSLRCINTNSLTEEDGIVIRILYDLFSRGQSCMKNLNSITQSNSSSSKYSTRRGVTVMSNSNTITTTSALIHFALQISMVYVYQDHVYDMLGHYNGNNNSSSSKGTKHDSSMNQLRITQHPETKDFVTSPTVITSISLEDASKAIHYGLQQGHTAPTYLNEGSSRGHTLITIRPISTLDSKVVEQGGAISILDMAGIERSSSQTHFNKLSTPTEMKTSISINSSISVLLQCLRALKLKSSQEPCDATENKPTLPTKLVGESIITPLKETSQNHEHFLSPKSLLRRRFAQSPALVKQDENQSVKTESLEDNLKHQSQAKQLSKSVAKPSQIPFRDNKLTMILQPFISGDGSNYMNSGISSSLSDYDLVETTVTLIVFAYPGVKDYHEKKFLLSEIDSLGSLHWSKEKSKVGELHVGRSLNTPTVYNKSKRIVEPDVKKEASSRFNDSMADSSYWTNIVNALEEENKNLKSNVESLSRKCQELEEQNEYLKSSLSSNCPAAHVEKSHEAEFLESRKVRRKEQTLLPSPLRDHMQNVEQHRMIETGTVRQATLGQSASFPLSLDIGRKRIRITDSCSSHDDTELWKYLSNASGM